MGQIRELNAHLAQELVKVRENSWGGGAIVDLAATLYQPSESADD